jgi:hypothetical protein
MEQPSLVNHRRRSLLPVVRERTALADSLARLLGQLGLERKAKAIPALADYLKSKMPAPSIPAAPTPTPEATE